MEDQIVTCSGMDCSVCGILEVVSNLFRYLMGVSGAVAVLLLVIAGFFYIASLGNQKEFDRAKTFFKFSIFGFGLTLVSFITVSSIIFISGARDKDNWFQIDCSVKSEDQLSESQKPQAAEIKYKFVKAANVFFSVSDPEKITGLDISSLSPENLLLDSLSLLPGQTIRFIVSDKTLTEADIKDYVSQKKGYYVPPSGDRGAGVNTQEMISIIRDEENIMVGSEGENPEILGEFNINDDTSKSEDLLGQTIDFLSSQKNEGKNVYVFNDKNQEEKFLLDKAACQESGGEVIVFQSECTARKQACGESSILCSDIEDEIQGCQCPAGSCVKDQKCVKIEEASETSSDQDNDGILDSKDRCPNTPEGETIDKDKTSADYGCGCSQLKLTDRVCPPSRCEGSNMITYPAGGKDTCVSGKRTMYPCEPQSQYNQQCQQAVNQNIQSQTPSGNNQGDQDSMLAELLKNLGKSGGGSGSNSGGGSGSSGGGGGGGGGNNGGTPSDNSGSPSATPTETIKPLTLQEAFEGGNGSAKDPFTMSEKAMEEVFSYNEQTGKLDLDKNWESKLGVLGKDYYVKIPDKEKIMKAVDKKRKEKGQKELTDEQKEKLKNDKESTKAPDGAKVVDKKDNKEQTVDSKKDKNKADPSKTDNSLDSEEQVLKARTAGVSDYDPNKNYTAAEAKRLGLVKADDGTFTKRVFNDYFNKNFMSGLNRMSDILKEQGYGMGLTSGFRPGAVTDSGNTSMHASGNAADVYLTDPGGGRLPVNTETVGIIRNAAAGAGMKMLERNYDWGRHVSPNGH